MIVALVTRKKKKQANITFKAGSGHFLLPAEAGHAVLNSEAGGPHRCPSQILQTVVFKTVQFFASSYFDPQESSSDGRHSALASFKMTSRRWVLVSREKFWSQCQAGPSTSWGLGTQGLCFKPPDHRKLLPSRDFFFLNKGKVHCTPPSTGRK